MHPFHYSKIPLDLVAKTPTQIRVVPRADTSIQITLQVRRLKAGEDLSKMRRPAIAFLVPGAKIAGDKYDRSTSGSETDIEFDFGYFHVKRGKKYIVYIQPVKGPIVSHQRRPTILLHEWRPVWSGFMLLNFGSKFIGVCFLLGGSASLLWRLKHQYMVRRA
jgi:hypothetical protein